MDDEITPDDTLPDEAYFDTLVELVCPEFDDPTDDEQPRRLAVERRIFRPPTED